MLFVLNYLPSHSPPTPHKKNKKENVFRYKKREAKVLRFWDHFFEY